MPRQTDSDVPLLTVELPIELTNGNDGRGSRWFKSSIVRKKLEKVLRSMQLIRQPFDVAVIVELTRILGKNQRLWDSDSGLRGNSKELIDAMVVCGWFHDDGPTWITETRFYQDATRRESGPAIIIEVFHSE